jgi:hypothetical protein
MTSLENTGTGCAGAAAGVGVALQAPHAAAKIQVATRLVTCESDGTDDMPHLSTKIQVIARLATIAALDAIDDSLTPEQRLDVELSREIARVTANLLQSGLLARLEGRAIDCAVEFCR